MQFESSLVPAILQRRYKRFLADVTLDDGSQITVHTPNTGSMLGCQDEGMRVWLLPASNPKRKYSFSWELVEAKPGVLVGINTGRTNSLVAEAVTAGLVVPLRGYGSLRREVAVDGGSSRIDFLLSDHPKRPDCYLEVKNVTAAVSGSTALFPDAVSARATKHLDTLITLKASGFRAALLFCVQRADVSRVRPAREIDPAYADALERARDAGVEVFAYGARVTPDTVELVRRLQVRPG